MFLKYCENVIGAQKIQIYLRSQCIYIFDRGVGVDAFQASLVSVFLYMSIHFKSSETKTTIDPDKLFEEIAPSL